MIDPFDLWKKFCSDNNTFQGGFFRPDRDYQENLNAISLDAFATFTAMDEKAQQIEDWLAPFAKTVNIIVTPGAGNYGVAKYPAAPNPNPYEAYKAARSLQYKDKCMCEDGAEIFSVDSEGKCAKATETEIQKQERVERYKAGIFEATITKVPSSKWSATLEHETKCPTFESPKITQFDEGFKVAPRSVSVMVLDYYKKPKAAKFAYTIAPGNPQTGAGDYLVYDLANSVPLEWPQSMIPYFLDKLQQIYAKFTRDPELFQMNKAS